MKQLALFLITLGFAVSFGQSYKKAYSYSCQEGMRKTCRTITSCEEAMLYLKQCGISRLDADADGIPCECDACKHMNPNAERCKRYGK